MRWLRFILLVPAACAGTITIDYPAPASIFPPDFAAPTFVWRDRTAGVARWRIDISFADHAPELHVVTAGPGMRIGEIDPDCIAATNRPPALTPEQAAAHTWPPATALWNAIRKHPAVTVTITGLHGGQAVSSARVAFTISKDPVGAPIFYRDVPLMPSETQTGVIKPIASEAVRLIAWRLRDVSQPRSRLLLDGLPMCANCHSFSNDGRTLGMDMDGLQNNRGMYMLAGVRPATQIHNEDVIQWSTAEGPLKGLLRIGFMSQVSPDGKYVVTTIDSPSHARSSNYYVANFTDYRFLQVFYPARGVLAWYSKETGILKPLAGADDPRFVQMGGVWSPDGKYLVFARAAAQDPNPPGGLLARFANDPHELQIRYDLYRIPFRDGRGGTAEPIAGASNNGMSNSFPKVSPDGRWIVFVKAANGLLMRPDSELYIVPSSGGEARRLSANAAPMNSWHSFSPNGRWLVFSSKRQSPYTRMYLTHIDENGKDSPAILIENTAAANRAVNLPEFVNIARGGMQSLGGPVVDYFKGFDRAMYYQKQGRYAEAVAEWKRVVEVRPDDPISQGNLGMTLMLAGRREEAAVPMRKARELKLAQAVEAAPANAGLRASYGQVLLESGRVEEARAELERAVKLDGRSASAHNVLGDALLARGDDRAALSEWRTAIRFAPDDAAALRKAAWLMATSSDGKLRNAEEAVALALRAVETTKSEDSGCLDTLAAAYAEAGRFKDAVATERRALAVSPAAPAEAFRRRLALYESSQPYRSCTRLGDCLTGPGK